MISGGPKKGNFLISCGFLDFWGGVLIPHLFCFTGVVGINQKKVCHMKITFPCSLGVSRKFKSKAGKDLVTVKLNFLGGHFEVFVPESLVPDCIEGKEVNASLELGSDQNGKPTLRLLGFNY